MRPDFPAGLTTNRPPSSADTVLSTSYEAIMALSDGDLTLDQYFDQLEVLEGAEQAAAFLELFRGGAIARSGAAQQE